MGESLLFSLNSTMPLFFIMVLGCLLHRKNFLTDDFVAMANKFVFNVALPVQLFRETFLQDSMYFGWDFSYMDCCLHWAAFFTMDIRSWKNAIWEQQSTGWRHWCLDCHYWKYQVLR